MDFPHDEDNRAIKILIVDDHKIFLEGLMKLLSAEKDFSVVGMALNGRDAIRMASELLPDLVLLDISLPDMKGSEVARRIVQKLPEARIVALTIHSEKEYVHRMMKAGATGYLVKDCSLKEIVHCIRGVAGGMSYLCASVANVVIKDFIGDKESENNGSGLTERENQVLRLIADGLSTKAIAAKLGISAKTIETHRRQIMHKLNIFNIPQLTKYALREGLTSLELENDR